MPPAELKEWITLTKDALLGVAAFITTIVAVYGALIWKREMAGKEIYAATKTLIMESHLLTTATNQARRPIQDHERKAFSAEEIKQTTENERWRVSEADAYKMRMNALSLARERYQSALLEVRVLVGTKVYLGFIDFGELVTEVVRRIGNYITLLQDHTKIVLPESPEVQEALRGLCSYDDNSDELSLKIGYARLDGEKHLLPFLHRKSIRG
ncbi:hypothetical protein DLREEDagrD3_10890 [Denitratisoma sp. agr-D3]